MYTKGEWKANELLKDGEYGAFSITADDKGELTAVADIFAWPEAKANAHLIAAAPDMYEALEKIRTISPETIMDTGTKALVIYDIATKAIAKVKK